MNQIAGLLRPTTVAVDVDVSSKKRLFETIGELFATQGLSASLVFESLLAREKLGSTGLGQGIAIPHGRIKGLKEAAGAFVRLRTPIAFDAPDNQPVSMIFVLLVPEQATDLHLHILGELAQLFSDPAMRTTLASQPDASAILQAIGNWNAS